jgi:hypothetical protein
MNNPKPKTDPALKPTGIEEDLEPEPNRGPNLIILYLLLGLALLAAMACAAAIVYPFYIRR